MNLVSDIIWPKKLDNNQYNPVKDIGYYGNYSIIVLFKIMFFICKPREEQCRNHVAGRYQLYNNYH